MLSLQGAQQTLLLPPFSILEQKMGKRPKASQAPLSAALSFHKQSRARASDEPLWVPSLIRGLCHLGLGMGTGCSSQGWPSGVLLGHTSHSDCWLQEAERRRGEEAWGKASQEKGKEKWREAERAGATHASGEGRGRQAEGETQRRGAGP